MLSIYFDTCALNRLSDDESTVRVRNEATAVLRLLDLVAQRKVRWTASTVLLAEIAQNPDPVERENALALLEAATILAAPKLPGVRRALELEAIGLRGLDSLHLAIAEQEAVDWLVTVDDRFLRFTLRHSETTALQLINPVDLIQRRFPWLLPRP